MMGDGMTAPVAPLAPCAVTMVPIWQAATPIDRVDDVQGDMSPKTSKYRR